MAIDVKPRSDADRIKAFELYLHASTGGKYRSLRSIASEIGVSAMTVSRWREVDKWDEKIKKVLVQTSDTAESTSQAIKRRVRSGLLDGLDELHKMAKDRDLSAKDRIDAVKAISAIALKIDAVTAGAFGKDAAEANVAHDFNDDLETTWPPTTERPSKPDDSGVEEPSPEQPSLTPEPSSSQSLPNSEEALELLLADEQSAQ